MKVDKYHFLLVGMMIGVLMAFGLISLQDSRGSMGGIVSHVNVSNLSEEDKIVARDLFNEIKREYLIGNKVMIFKYNITEEAKKLPKTNIGYYYPEKMSGLNQRRPMWMGSIIHIRFGENIEQIKETICHELLHNFMELNSFAHDVIEDIEEYDVCFVVDEESAP